MNVSAKLSEANLIFFGSATVFPVCSQQVSSSSFWLRFSRSADRFTTLSFRPPPAGKLSLWPTAAACLCLLLPDRIYLFIYFGSCLPLMLTGRRASFPISALSREPSTHRLGPTPTRSAPTHFLFDSPAENDLHETVEFFLTSKMDAADETREGESLCVSRYAGAFKSLSGAARPQDVQPSGRLRSPETVQHTHTHTSQVRAGRCNRPKNFHPVLSSRVCFCHRVTKRIQTPH